MLCKEAEERRQVQREVLIGTAGSKNIVAEPTPAVWIDFSQDAILEQKVKVGYRKRWFKYFDIHIEPEGWIELESAKELLDGNRLENLYIKFKPEHSDDVDYFFGHAEELKFWKLIVRLPRSELHFIVNYGNGEVMAQYASRHKSTIIPYKVSA